MKHIEKIIQVNLESIVNSDREEFLDLLSELTIGSAGLMDINYRITGYDTPKTIWLVVNGDYEEGEL